MQMLHKKPVAECGNLMLHLRLPKCAGLDCKPEAAVPQLADVDKYDGPQHDGPQPPPPLPPVKYPYITNKWLIERFDDKLSLWKQDKAEIIMWKRYLEIACASFFPEGMKYIPRSGLIKGI
jgi:hypothetical protein